MKTHHMGHRIKRRRNARDIFITPVDLAKEHISVVASFCEGGERWLDPFRNSGHYYDHFPTDHKEWCEILDGRDFFTFDTGQVDVICSNPPYSLMDAVFRRSREHQPKIISYLIGVNNLTTKRMEKMNKAGYMLVYVRMLKVYSWFGMSFICVWKKCDAPNIIHYDRKIWK